VKGDVAYFDLDGTILDASSEGLFFRYLCNHYGFTFKIKSSSRWLLGSLSRLFRFQSFYDAFRNRNYLKGLSWSEISNLAAEFAQTHLFQYVSPAAVKRLEWHRSRGDRIVIVSASLQPLAETIGTHLGVDKTYASVLPTNSRGHILGRENNAIIPRRKTKIRVIQNDALKHEYDLRDSWGYGNSYADKWFMEVCGSAITVNPDRRLMKLAKKNHWEVVEWETVF